jgi:hypothetical protein
MDSFDRVDVVVGISPPELKTVVAYPGFKAAIVQTPVVMTGDTVGAMAASLPGFPCHASPYLNEMLRVFPEGNHFTGPFMAGNERIGWRPISRETSPNDFRIRAANRHRPDPAKDLKGTRRGDRHLLNFKRAGSGQDQGLHGFRNRLVHKGFSFPDESSDLI